MIELVNHLIEEEYTACPYCGDNMPDTGCCGESSDHGETAYVYQNEIYLDSEVLITRGPLLPWLIHEIKCILISKYYRKQLLTKLLRGR